MERPPFRLSEPQRSEGEFAEGQRSKSHLWERASALDDWGEGFGLPFEPGRALPLLLFEQAKKMKSRNGKDFCALQFEVNLVGLRSKDLATRL